ncbi:phage tail sheath protein [Candidatus Koribacter versatilis Ellin345]|uniref:Phage tail sheath protein n=1 Tax=Koribacter versatilis (strain Ellin345) TaxID=204669 RepID=Q1ITD2_KORVE|nr:phage tail sheath C-terminal domain-containing protein [Candidatus Koribacter versatilis]ABF39868.1 phage tail sheath protein [Candidatus Koribacter versatilis Ellin345]
MPPTFTFPGVYIEEIPSGVHTITGVATSIAAFVGWAAQGPTDEATLVQSWADFANQFGGLDARSNLGYSVNQFFNNGGQQAYIVRLVSDTTNGNTAAATASVNIKTITFDASVSPSKVTVTKGAAGLTISAANQGAWAKNYSIQVQPRIDDYNRFTLSVVYTDPVTSAQTIVESYSNLSTNSADTQGRYVVNILNEQSNYVTAKMAPTPVTLTVTPGVPTTPKASNPGSIALNASVDGNDGTPLAPGDTVFEKMLNSGGAGTAGVRLLDTVPIFNILCVPGETVVQNITELQAYCVDNRAFLIVDSKSDDKVKDLALNGPAGITGVNSINSALYFPWVNQFDSQTNSTRAFPPCGFVAGLYAATDTARGVWKAPAGIDASLTGDTGLTLNLTNAQNGSLNIQAINCLRNFPVYGDVIWGARTLRGNNQVGSEWKYVPIRRLALFLESSLYDGTQWVVFEPNDEKLWGQIRMNVGAFMQGLFLQGAFQGTSPQQAYFVKCDADNNPQSSIDQGIVNILVGFAPLYPAEFVVIQIQQMAGQLQA